MARASALTAICIDTTVKNTKMTLILVLGDLNIPFHAVDIPAQFKKLLVPGKIQQILCTGNLNYKNSAIMDYLRSISSEIVCVSGANDTLHSAHSPVQSSKTLSVGSFRIGVINGYQLIPWNDINILSMHARSHSLDILITGNSSKFEAFESENVIYLNPGSITAGNNGTPSFALMDINVNKVTIYVYNLVDDNVVVEKLEFSK